MSAPASKCYNAGDLERGLDELQGWACVLIALAYGKRDVEPEAIRVIGHALDECRERLFDAAGINMGVPR